MSQEVGRSVRLLNASTRFKCSARSQPSGAYTSTRGATPGTSPLNEGGMEVPGVERHQPYL